MKVKISMPTYNQEKYIGQAIEGVVNQKTNFSFELIISDDCSTDLTREIIEEYRKKYPNIVKPILNKKNYGAMGNFKHTLMTIKDAEYVALCDGDDYWTDMNKLQKQVDFLDNHKDYSMCAHESRMFYQNGSKPDQILSTEVEETSTFDDLVKSNYIVANSVMYRWDFNDKNLEDYFPDDIAPGDYLIHLIHAKNGKIKMFKEVMSDYRRHEEGMWWSNADAAKEQFNLKYGRKTLNFYNNADKLFDLPKETFYYHRADVIYGCIVAYVKNKQIDKLQELRANEREIAILNQCMLDIVNRNIWFLDYLKAEEEKKRVIQEQEEQEKNRKNIKERIIKKLRGNKNEKSEK